MAFSECFQVGVIGGRADAKARRYEVEWFLGSSNHSDVLCVGECMVKGRLESWSKGCTLCPVLRSVELVMYSTVY